MPFKPTSPALMLLWSKPDEKRLLHDATSSVAVDMESHVAAEAAEAHGLPFAACRVILDPAHRALPPAALIDLRPDGTPDVAAVLRSVIRHPRQLPALLNVAADARAARLALRAGRRRLGPGLSFWGLQGPRARDRSARPARLAKGMFQGFCCRPDLCGARRQVLSQSVRPRPPLSRSFGACECKNVMRDLATALRR